jgi:hypothetical protein
VEYHLATRFRVKFGSAICHLIAVTVSATRNAVAITQSVAASVANDPKATLNACP